YSSRRRHTRSKRDWSSDVCSSDLIREAVMFGLPTEVVVMAGSLVLGLLMIMIVIDRMYRKVGPNEALIRYGMGGTEVYCGRGARSEERRGGKECGWRRRRVMVGG